MKVEISHRVRKGVVDRESLVTGEAGLVLIGKGVERRRARRGVLEGGKTENCGIRLSVACWQHWRQARHHTATALVWHSRATLPTPARPPSRGPRHHMCCSTPALVAAAELMSQFPFLFCIYLRHILFCCKEYSLGVLLDVPVKILSDIITKIFRPFITGCNFSCVCSLMFTLTNS